MEKKVYNLSETSLGKITFMDGTVFISVTFVADSGEKINEVILVPSIEDGIRKFPGFFMELGFKYVQDKLTFHNRIIEWMGENWFENGIKSFQKEMAEVHGFPDFLSMDPMEWVKSEPEMVPLILVHIASRFTNGYLKLPGSIRDLEISVRFVKNVLAINFWEEGNPVPKIQGMHTNTPRG
ncbi:hypothetical protein SCHIN_v1c06360 [Spiroplasma chinense]|uniref:Uncharacterized protein n=1 Tax=Spiroplasma chinense TaxID=216932 RepID=A0A5B9Y4X1_9MOLU|nr:hypothetical protein [Spiroplasma chinense]QEH61833.1 hypothetical protein SCHIN_v1c06360 [Spiroplasma chinense]